MRERIAAEVRRVIGGRQSRLKDESCGNDAVNDFYGVNFKDMGVSGILIFPEKNICLKSPLMSLGMP